MKQFHFSSNLSTLMELYLTTRNEEGYLSDHYGYYLQELDCLSKAMQNESFVTRELVEIVGLTEDDFGELLPEFVEKYEKMFHQPRKFVTYTDSEGKVHLDVDYCTPEE